MSQEMKANVLIYTETNRSFIEEKVYDEFRYECLKDEELKDLDAEKMVNVLKKIYDFGEGNPYMADFFKRAPDNIHKFVTEKYKTTNETEDLVIDIGKLLDVIFACIQGGFDQDKPKQKQKEKQKSKEHTPQNPETQEIIQEQIDAPKQKVKKFYVPKPKTPEKKNFIENYEMPQKKMPARYLMHMAKQVKKQQEVPSQPEVEPLDNAFIEKNRLALESRLQDLYHHYCAQQQNLGQHATFDRIKEECSQMTVGKFLLFCKVSKTFEDKEITKEILISKYKKIAEGKKEIQFTHFKDLLSLVDEEYIKARKKVLGPDAAVPTYEARLMLQGHEYKKLKKDVDLPFTTRQKQGRELKKYATVENSRYIKRDQLTSHSGKFGKDLKQEIERKLVSQSVASKQKEQRKKMQNSSQKSKIIRLEAIRHQHLQHIQGMEWLVEEDDDDKAFMKDYRARDVVGELKKRVTDLQKMEKSRLA